MRPRKKLTALEAWRVIARQIAEGEWAQTGLCREISTLHYRGRIDAVTWLAMKHQIDARLAAMKEAGELWTENQYFDRFRAPDSERANNRVLFALLLALEVLEGL